MNGLEVTDIFFRIFDAIMLMIAVGLGGATAVWRMRADRGQRRINESQQKINTSVQDNLESLGRRMDNLRVSFDRLDAENVGYRELLDHPTKVHPAPDRWGAYDKAWERLQNEIDAIETNHLFHKDDDKHEPGS